jgi:uncharacterized protein YegL
MRTRSLSILGLSPLFLAACGGAAYDLPTASSAAAPEASGGEPVAVTAKESTPGMPTEASPLAAPSPAPPAPPVSVTAAPSRERSGAAGVAPAYAPQYASIKAGEWDDNANYREFQRYLAGEADLGFHRVDVTERRFLVVRDADGKAVPRCPVLVSDADQHAVTLTTTTSGRAILFPHAEGLAGRALTASTTCAGSTARARFSLDGADGVVALELPTRRSLAPSRTIDVAFILDTTGSMSEEISAVKSTIQKVTSSLGGEAVQVRIGMVAYKDRGDEYVTKVFPMTTDLGRFGADVSGVQASGGGDMPESVNEGIHAALSRLDWNDAAVAKFAFLVGDAPPHLDYRQDFDYAAEMKDAAHRGIQIFTIAASGMDDLGQVVWRQVAEYTQATNLFVLRGGAGPQSTGAGDPKSSCGGTQTSYASGNLDALILGKIHRELKGLDRDPMKIPGLGTDENAKPCADRLIAAD